MNLLDSLPIGRSSPERLFRPRSVAVIGAGTAAGAQVMDNLAGGGFKGAILPVDAGLKAVSGIPAYSEIAALPAAPDLAIIATGPADTARAIEELAAKGTFAVVVVGAAPNLAEIAGRTGVRALGPSSFGICVPAIGLNASRAHQAPPKGRLSLVSQSAALCRAVIDWAGPNGIGFSHIVGLGGNADLGFAAVLDWLSRDPSTGAILLDVRAIKQRRASLSAARAAAGLRPVVAIHPGRRLTDPSGTAELATDAALRRVGVLSVWNLEDLLAAAETLTRARPVRNEGLAIVTNAIGPAMMAGDAVLRSGLTLATLSERTRTVLGMSLPVSPSLQAREGGNVPSIDAGVVHVSLDAPMLLPEVTAMLAGAPEVGCVLVVHAPTGLADHAVMAALGACRQTIKVPLLVCAMGETTGAGHRSALAAAGVPSFASPEQAVRGFMHLVHNRRSRAAARELPPSTVLTVAPDRLLVRSLFAEARRGGRLALAQDEAMAVLSAYGLPAVPSRPAYSSEDAGAAASLLGYPAVVKLRRTERPSAAARGGLVLDLPDEPAVRMAARSLEAGRSCRSDAGDAARGFLVQRRVGRARELLVRVADDPSFGPTVLFGQGGTTAEIVRDFAMDLPPLNLPLARALIARTRVAATLTEFRDMPAANVEAIAQALVRVSQIVVDFPEIAELEINPLFADADGVLVADAWLRLRAAGEPASPLAISPYPSEWVGHWSARGERLIIRPIRPEDAEQHGALFHRLSPDDVRFRFFSSIRELSPEQTVRMTQVDYDREMAFVAIRETTGEMVGVSRLVCERDGQSGEFAVVVQPDMKGRGLASHLMHHLLDWARARGLSEVVGQVLADNAPMLAFVRHLGFEVHRMPGEEDLVEARIRLKERALA